MRYERQQRLVERLLEKTRAGEVDWQESALANAFQLLLSNHTIQIYRSVDRKHDLFQLEIQDVLGAIIESFNSDDLTNDDEAPLTNRHTLMHELFELARRKVRNADEVLDSMLAEMA